MIYDTMKKNFQEAKLKTNLFQFQYGTIKNASRKRVWKTLQYYKKYFSNPNFSLKKSFKKALKTFLLPSFNLSANTP